MIRRLDGRDGEAFWKLRLQALEDEPQAFGESAAEFRQKTPQQTAERLRMSGADNFVMGLFEGSTLIGTSGFYRERGAKRRHKGRIWGVYIAPEHRGKGLSRTLLAALIEAARALPDLAAIYLSVAAPQEAAQRVYRSLGFQRFGTEPLALRVGDRYFAEDHFVLELAGMQ